jgi:HPt (histidine-containing phosphotransfer) domain-containing protein
LCLLTSERSGASAVFDRAEALARVCGNLALLRELAEMFLEDAPQWLAAIRDTLRVGDASGLRRAAHTLRGSVSSFSAREAEEAAGRLEGLARAGDLAAAVDALPAVEGALARLRDVLGDLAKPEVPPSRHSTPLPWRRPRIQESPP